MKHEIGFFLSGGPTPKVALDPAMALFPNNFFYYFGNHYKTLALNQSSYTFIKFFSLEPTSITSTEITYHITLIYMKLYNKSNISNAMYPLGSPSGPKHFSLVGRLEENSVDHCGFWGALCLHIAPTENNTCNGFEYIVVFVSLSYLYTRAALLMYLLCDRYHTSSYIS